LNTDSIDLLPDEDEAGISTDKQTEVNRLTIKREALKKKLLDASLGNTESYFSLLNTDDASVHKLKEDEPEKEEGEDEVSFQDRMTAWDRMMDIYNALK
jgi:hypothetical protein